MHFSQGTHNDDTVLIYILFIYKEHCSTLNHIILYVIQNNQIKTWLEVWTGWLQGGDGGSMDLWNAGMLQQHSTAAQSRRPQLEPSPLWKLQNWHQNDFCSMLTIWFNICLLVPIWIQILLHSIKLFLTSLRGTWSTSYPGYWLSWLKFSWFPSTPVDRAFK
jgi:hypothetical protein